VQMEGGAVWCVGVGRCVFVFGVFGGGDLTVTSR